MLFCGAVCYAVNGRLNCNCLELVVEILRCVHSVKTNEFYFPVVLLIILYKIALINQAPVVQRVDNFIQRIEYIS